MMSQVNGSGPLSIFQVAGRAMSAQLVRMNTTASNLANAGNSASTAEAAYKTMKPVFRTSFDAASGMSTVDVEKVVTAGEAPTKRYDPSNPIADKDGNVFDAAVDETRELVDMMETARGYQNNIEVMNTAKSLIIDTLKLGR
jgi:flagellar basal-body rod protein FlgC